LIAFIRHSGGLTDVFRVCWLNSALKQCLESTKYLASDSPPICPTVVVHKFLERLGIRHEMRRIAGNGPDDTGAGFIVLMLPAGGGSARVKAADRLKATPDEPAAPTRNR